MPPEAETTGSVSGGRISVNVAGPSGSTSFSINASGSGDVLVIDFGAGAPAPPDARQASLMGADYRQNIRSAFGSTDVGTAMSAAWAVGCIIDVLEQNPDSGIDPAKVVVTGCSTNGKLATIAAVFEPRVGLGAPVESGACGTTAWRVSTEHGGGNPDTDCQDITTLETDWLGTVAAPFRNGSVPVTRLPFDQHELLAIRAPKPMIAFNNSKDCGAPPRSGGAGSSQRPRENNSSSAMAGAAEEALHPHPLGVQCFRSPFRAVN